MKSGKTPSADEDTIKKAPENYGTDFVVRLFLVQTKMFSWHRISRTTKY